MRYPTVYLSICLSLALVLCPSPSRSEEQNAITGSAPASSTTLKGNVVEAQVTLNELQDARLSIKRVRKAAANLYDEVGRQEIMMTTNVDVVGTNVITTPRPVPTGRLLPARKRWVDASMAEIGPVIKLFKEDVDQAIEDDRHTLVSDSARKAFEPIRDDAFARVKSAFEVYKELEGLTAGPSYDNTAIAATVGNLDSCMKQIDRSLKKGISILQKEAKASSRAKELKHR